MPRISRSLRRPTDNSPEAVARRRATRERAARAEVLAREQARAAREADTDWSMRREANRSSPAAASFDNILARAAALPPRVLTTDEVRRRNRGSEARAAPTVSLPSFFPDAGGLFGREAEEGRYGSDQAWLDEYTPNLYLPIARTFNALTEIPDRLRGVNRADRFVERSTEGARNMRTVGEGLWGPEEIIGSGNRVNAGEGGLMDALILGTTALPVRAIREPVGAALRSVMPDFAVNAGRRARAWWDEVPYDPLRVDVPTSTRNEAASLAVNPLWEEARPRPSANVGLVVENDMSGTGFREQIGADAVRRALEDRGLRIEREQLRTSTTEPTFVAELDRALSPEEAFDISQELRQKAIAHVGPRGGRLDGPNAADWGTFNDEFYIPYDEPAGLTAFPRVDVTDPANVAAVADMARMQRQLREIELAQRAGDEGVPFLSQLPPEERLRSDFAVMGGDTLATPADWQRALAVERRGEPLSPLNVRGEHYSRVGDLTQTDPSFYGTGHVGSERQMVRNEGLPDRTYFYAQGADGTPIYPEEPVSLRAPYRYEADLQNLYDVNADPDQLAALARAHAGLDPVTGAPYEPTIPLWMHEGQGVESANTATPDLERLIRQSGYGGYISNFAPSWEPLSRRAAAVFDPVTVRRLP